VPPIQSVAVSQSLNQRWRERPLCPALRVTPGGRGGVVHAIVGRVRRRRLCVSVVQEERAAHVHVRASGFTGATGRRIARQSAYARNGFSVDEMSHCRARFHTIHHRAFDAGAVLGIVNALRFASTRPTAGPSGIDDPSARARFSNYAMVGNLSITRRWLTRESRRRMLTPSRRCRMALPPFADTAYGARIRPAPTGHGIERNSQKSQSDARRPRVVRRRRLSCESRCLSPRVILRSRAAQKMRSPAATSAPD
jgi:hypothetical protein